MLSFFYEAAIRNFVLEIRGPIAKPRYKALLQNKVTRRGPNHRLFPSRTHPRIAADEISTCRS